MGEMGVGWDSKTVTEWRGANARAKRKDDHEVPLEAQTKECLIAYIHSLEDERDKRRTCLCSDPTKQNA